VSLVRRVAITGRVGRGARCRDRGRIRAGRIAPLGERRMTGHKQERDREGATNEEPHLTSPFSESAGKPECRPPVVIETPARMKVRSRRAVKQSRARKSVWATRK